MLWIDGFLAVPVIGIGIKIPLHKVAQYERCGEAFMQTLYEELGDLEIKRLAWGYAIDVQNHGYEFLFSHTKLQGRFAYKIEQKEQAGRLPLTTTPHLEVYTTLLAKVESYLEKAISYLNELDGMQYSQIGIVATLEIDKDSRPPALVKWVSHLAKPWTDTFTKINTHILAPVAKAEGHTDRCHHIVKHDAAQHLGYHFSFDWQRTFDPPQSFGPKGLTKQLRDCMTAATNYFGRIGEGDFDYE